MAIELLIKQGYTGMQITIAIEFHLLIASVFRIWSTTFSALFVSDALIGIEALFLFFLLAILRSYLG